MTPILTAAEKKTSTQVSQANNLASKDYGLFLSVPDFLERNVDDDQEITDPNYEKWDLEHQPSLKEDEVKEVTISAKALPGGGTVTLTIEEEVESIVSPLLLDGEVIYWTDSIKTARYPKPNHRVITWELPDEANSDGILNEALFIEGVKITTNAKAIKFIAVLETQGKTVKKTGGTGVFQVDLDVDSNNNNGFNFLGFDDAEDKIEASDKPETSGSLKPGKIVLMNKSNSDDDEVPDFADGFNLGGVAAGVGSNELVSVTNELKFTPVQVELHKPFNMDNTTVTFHYDPNDESIPKINEGIEMAGAGTAEDPIVFKIKKGGMRLWRKKAEERTSGDTVPSGDFVPVDTKIPWKDLFTDTASISRKVELYLEYVDKLPPTKNGRKLIKIEAEEDKQVKAKDSAHVTLVPVVVQQVSFDGAKYYQLIEDKYKTPPILNPLTGIFSPPTETQLGPPHWLDTDKNENPTTAAGEHNYSLAFASTSKPKAESKFEVIGLPSGATYEIMGIGTDGIEFETASATIVGNTYTYPMKAAKADWRSTNEVGFYSRSKPSEAFVIQWKIKVYGEWIDLGRTYHQVYLTLNDSLASYRHESIYFHACRNAKGKKAGEEDIIVDKIYDEFTDKKVSRIDPISGKDTVDFVGGGKWTAVLGLYAGRRTVSFLSRNVRISPLWHNHMWYMGPLFQRDVKCAWNFQ